MKILHVVPSFSLGGMEKVLCSVLNALPDQVHQEIISLNEERGAEQWIQRGNVRFVDFDRPQGNFPFFGALYQALRQSSPDLLMTYNWGATDAIWLGKLAGITAILHSEHGFNIDEALTTQWKRNAVRYVVYRLATRVIVVSQALKQMMESQLTIHCDRVAFIPNGINTDFFVPHVYEREKMRNELGISDDDIVMGFSGRLDPVKNIPFLLDVFLGCVRKDHRFKLVLIGDGEEREGISRFADDHSLQDQIVITGRKPNILNYVRALDMFVLTSFREEMPMGMLEAMSAGVPVVASAVGEIPSILQGQKAGFSFPLSEGVVSFVNSCLALRDPHLRQQMGESSRQLVLDRFQERAMIQSYLDLLSQVTGKHTENFSGS